MSNTIKTFFTGLGATGIIATAGLVYTHNKTHEANLLNRKENLDLPRERLALEKEALELEKFKNNLPSTFDRTIAVKPEGDTTTSPKSVVDNIFTTQSPFELDHLIDNPQTIKLAGLAVLCATVGIILANSIILFNLLSKKYINEKALKSPTNSLLSQFNNFYSIYSDISTKLLLSFLFYFLSLLVFIGFYILLFI